MAQKVECTLEDNIAEYTDNQGLLEAFAWGKWVVYDEKKLIMNGGEHGFKTENDALSVAAPLIAAGHHPLVRWVGASGCERPGGVTSFVAEKPSFTASLRKQFFAADRPASALRL